MRRLRLVVDATQVPVELSGVATQVMAIGRALQTEPLDGVDVELRCPANVAEPLSAAYAPTTLITTPIPSSKPILRRLARQQLVAPVRDRRDTIVLAAGDQAPLLSRAPVILIAHDVRRLARQGDDSRADTLFYRTLQPPSIARADALLTVSAFSAGEIKRLAKPRVEPIVVQHHPRPRADAAEAPAPDAPLVVVGVLRGYKGTDDAIRALALLGERAPQLVLAGGGDDTPYKALAAELGVARCVRIAGWVAEAERDALYAGARAVLAPSHYEGYGLPVAEGLAWGRPVIASAIPPHLEILGGAGATYTPGDVEGLAERIRALDAPGAWAAASAASADRSRALAVSTPDWGAAIARAVAAVAPSVRR